MVANLTSYTLATSDLKIGDRVIWQDAPDLYRHSILLPFVRCGATKSGWIGASIQLHVQD